MHTVTILNFVNENKTSHKCIDDKKYGKVIKENKNQQLLEPTK